MYFVLYKYLYFVYIFILYVIIFIINVLFFKNKTKLKLFTCLMTKNLVRYLSIQIKNNNTSSYPRIIGTMDQLLPL